MEKDAQDFITSPPLARCVPFNPLSPNRDQQQFSPNNVHTLSRDKIVRIQKMTMKEKMP